MLQIALGLTILLAFWLTYTCYIRPKRLFNYYESTIKNLGYRVYVTPFKPFQMPLSKKNKEMEKIHGDGFYIQKNQHPNYDIGISNIFNIILITLINPDLIKDFFTPDKAVRVYRKHTKIVKSLSFIFGEGIVFSEGQTWKNKRKIISKAFTFQLIQQTTPEMIKICDDAFQIMENQSRDSGKVQGQEYSSYILELSTQIFINVILRSFFGGVKINQKIKGETFQQFNIKLLLDASEVSMSTVIGIGGKLAYNLGITKKIRDVKQRTKIYRGIASDIIKQREEEIRLTGFSDKKNTDLLSAIIYDREKGKNSKESSEFSYSNEDIMEEVCTFLIAGSETTSHFFMMMVYYMCDYPEVMAKVRAQINQITPNPEDITPEKMKLLTYVDWLQLQTIRFYGPGISIFPRQANQDNYLRDIPIKKGTGVIIHALGNHYSQKHYKNPKEFRPERWQSQCEGLHPFALFGFGAGPRNCVGKHLSLFSSKLALIKLIHRYSKIDIPEDKKINRFMKRKLPCEPERFDTRFTKA